MSRLIKIPPPVAIPEGVFPDGTVFPELGGAIIELTFKIFLEIGLGQYKPYGTWDKFDRAAIVRKKIRDIDKDTKELKLEEADYKDVFTACKTAKYNPNFGEILNSFKVALEKAEEIPEPK